MQAPGPPGDRVLGNLRQFGRDALGFLIELAREYGPVARFKLGPKPVYLVSSPSGMQHVFQDNYKNYGKGRPYARARFAFGQGLITLDGEDWRRHRKLAQPAFDKRRFPGFVRIMTEEAEHTVAQWQKAVASTGVGNDERSERAKRVASPEGRRARSQVDVAQGLRSLALRVTARALFTTDIDDHVDALERAFNQVQLWFTSGSKSGYLIPPTFPTPSNLRVKKEIAGLDARIYSILEKRRRSSDKPPDLLSMLMDARDEDDGSTLTDKELRDETFTLLFAAHESTAATMSWVLNLLSRYPDAERRVRAEVAEAGDATFEPSRLACTRRVLDETLRLYPAAPLIPRSVIDDDVIDGFEIPKGSTVFVSPYVAHRDRASWENPEAFDPDRFLPSEVAKRHKFAYQPFLLGPRQCIGNHFALTEMLIVIPAIVRHFRFELVPGKPVKSAHMRFGEGMWMTLGSVPHTQVRVEEQPAVGG
jgi:cytochrome P450